MPVSAAIIGGASLIGGIGSAFIGSSAAKTASDDQLQAAELAAQTEKDAEAQQLQMFDTAQGAEQPYNTVGQGASQTLASLYGINGPGGGTGAPTPQSLNAFTQSPDYQFALDQGTQAMQRSAAAGGTLISGGQLKAGQEFGQGLATQQYGNYFNRLLSLSQLGQSAAGGIASAAGTAGSNIGNTATGIANAIEGQGQAAASGVVGSANALTGGLNSATSGLSTAALISALGGKLGPSAAAPGASLSSYSPATLNQVDNLVPADI